MNSSNRVEVLVSAIRAADPSVGEGILESLLSLADDESVNIAGIY